VSQRGYAEAPRQEPKPKAVKVATRGGGGDRKPGPRTIANNKESLWYREELRKAKALIDPVVRTCLSACLIPATLADTVPLSS
jgi:hypothetical protein